jgi:predicted  nucleic acid-binding Zn-ribbon protein
LFVLAFVLVFLGVDFDKVLLVLTTLVSLEAIYLAIFIQMTVNRNTQSLEEVEEDIDEIQEDVEGIEKDIDEIQEDVEGMEKDIDEIQEDVDKLEEDEVEDDLHDEATMKTLDKLQVDMQRLMDDIQTLKSQKK